MRVEICQIGEDGSVPEIPREGDVVLVREGCATGEGWVEGLAAAAASEAGAATASPVVAAEPAPRADAGPPYPRLLAPSPACVYVRRAALDLCGPLDDGFAERCLRRGLQHLLAADVVVGWRGEAPAGERLSAAARAARAAALRSRPLSLTVDGRCLGERITGTQVHALELIGALRARDDLDLRVIVPARVGEHARALLDGLDTITYDEVRAGPPRTDVVHRPYQVTSEDDLGVLTLSGERAVVTHQDLIAFRNPAYHADGEAWAAHRRHTRAALGLADLVVFESEHAAADAAAEDLVADARVRVIGIGTDHSVLPAAAPERPDGAPDGSFLLVLGTDYLHKNRVFAMELVAALRDRHAWDGSLVLAGSRADFGSSAEEEAAWRAAHPEVPVHDLGAVAEHAKRWLYERAAAVAYPTTYEGFGLIPFEAAAHGTPCLWAPVTSLADVLDPGLATIVPWDAAQSADRAIDVLRAPAAQVAAIRAAARERTWARTAAALCDVYAEAAALPARVAVTAAADALAAEAARASWEARYWQLWHDIGPAGLALVGPDDPLLDPEDRNVLAGLLRRPVTGRPARATLRGLRRLT